MSRTVRPGRAGPILLGLLLAWLPLCGARAEPRTRFVMVTDTWAPFRMEEARLGSGNDGIDFQVIRRIGEELGLELEIQYHPWARALELLRVGRADLMTGVAYSPERDEYLLYVPTPYAAVRPALYTRAGMASTVRSYGDLAGKTIGQSAASVYFEPYDSDGSLDKLNLQYEEQLLRMLVLGRVDVVVGTEPNIGWDASRLGLSGLVEPALYEPEGRTELFIVVSERSPLGSRSAEIDAVIRRMLASGEIDAIMAAYR
ncbi:MAG: amino acid ABC transporter substrate-binding protein [Spirochaetaceae bacterium]|nr:amino acid ABC transporter substrate-binding protein [Spirochaetaceae bacterium]